MPSRRDVLGLCGGALLGLAGCVGPEGGRTGTAGTDDRTDGPDSDSTTADRDTDSPEPGTGIEVEGGSLAWERSLGDDLVSEPAFVDGTVAVAVGTDVVGLDAATGETAWTFETAVSIGDEYEYGRPTADLRVHEGTLYALVGISVGTGAHDHVLHALTADGDERWRFGTRVAGFHSFLGFGDGAVVVGTNDDAISDELDHAVFAIETADGSRRWTAESGDAMDGTVADGVALVEADTAVDCFDLETGERRFRSEAPDDARVTATAAGDGRAFLVFDRYDPEPDQPTMAAVSTADGSAAWDLAGEVVTSVRYLDDCYVGGERVARLGPDGNERWSYDGGGLIHDVPFDADALYTNPDSRIVSLARDSATERWTAEATDLAVPRVRAGDALVSSDGDARTVFAHAVDDGTELWRATLPGGYPPDPAAGPDGAYVATTAGGVGRVDL
ncbi:PQQ-binding-like beta-propeller repeat protein [Halobaculum sp. WSA2]|uniref:PQQ-binding-like beta-propeller repeat protein n=1 Tax=Halobaculum saliterrae TaxID=2073113 RepID=A0A6B0T3B8_9EURY|nr:PQQ-binding-like beta-propeller repeat protein [Halobaculum saliterrae]MXR40999.1 PQQ-binding-like beta-propeller repeat protein [Halobaculum saliterrae]